MSEKELRRVAGHKGTCRHSQTHYMSTPEPCTCGLDEALAADPDVVKVLRMLEDKLQWEKTHKYPNWLAHSQAINHVIGNIITVFYVRLTDDGWEWTDE